MFSSAGKRVRTVVALAVAASLTVVGVAAAEQGKGSQPGPKGPQSGAHGRLGPKQGPPPIGLPQGMTYAQVHVDHNGQTQVIALEEGKIVSVDESSITVRESDGTEASIPVGEGTTVHGKPGAQTSVSDLKAGMLVVVCGPEGGTAKSILIMPKRGGQGAGKEPAGGEGSGAAEGEGGPQAGPRAQGPRGRR